MIWKGTYTAIMAVWAWIAVGLIVTGVLDYFFDYAWANDTTFMAGWYLLFAIIPVAIKWLAILPGFFLIGGVLNALSAGAWASAVQIAVPALVFLWFFGSDITRRLKGKRRQMQRRDERLRELETPRHVCAVCGRDNLSDPTLEFRYLETPGGTQCRCIDDLDAA